jgi:hypothetical protein
MTTAILQKPTDQRIALQGTWDKFKRIQKEFEDFPGIKLSYFNGAIEILMPGREHEVFKGIIGMLLELFFLEKGIEFEPTGSMTQEKRARHRLRRMSPTASVHPASPRDCRCEVIFTVAAANWAITWHWRILMCGSGKMGYSPYIAYGEIATRESIRVKPYQIWTWIYSLAAFGGQTSSWKPRRRLEKHSVA